jgi:hypothetical protein
MELDNLIAIFGMQVLSVGALAVWWTGAHLTWKGYRSDGRAYLLAGTLLILFWSYLALRAGWVDFSLVIVLPALASIPVYWLYRHKGQSRVFIWIGVALLPALIALVLGIDTASSGGLIGYGGLAAAALASILPTYLYSKYTLRTPVPDDRQRAASGRWATVGTILGLTVGAAIVRGIVELLAPDLRVAVEAFLIGWLAFSILGCAGWRILWEIRKRGQ